MARKRKFRNKRVQLRDIRAGRPRFQLPPETQRWLWATAMFLAAVIFGLSFFNLAGIAGHFLIGSATFLIGRTVFILPILLVLFGTIVVKTHKQRFLPSISFAIIFSTLGIDGILGVLARHYGKEIQEFGGWLGYFISYLPMAAFGIWVSLLIFFALILLSMLAGWQLIRREISEGKESLGLESPGVLRKIFAPKFKVAEVGTTPQPVAKEQPRVEPLPSPAGWGGQRKPIAGTQPADLLLALQDRAKGTSIYKLPPLDLLEPDRGSAQSGDIKVNSAIIKRTLENFSIPVEISEVNVGPAVTQYAVKPAEGIKLSKIVALSNDLALALAAHPIRIEAPIPGRSLVGIEVPNRVRVQVRLRNLLEQPSFQTALSNLTFALGRDVAGNPVYADLSRMPHLLVAGSTGTGKTIGLNAIIMNLLYQNSPDILRLILIDPKRVEFPVYNDLPHLLTPVIYDAQRTVNALKWLIGEMERRFDVLSRVKARDIAGYNQIVVKEQEELMPYLVLIIDELADLMAARGRDVEAGIVRLAQMARAVGIHLVLATQRPSVEVITGLIKANVTSRMAFQVAAQVDSRTILDMSGAEKLLGLGDMLFISAEMSKPRRIQGAYVSEKEVKRVVKFIQEQAKGKEGVAEELPGAGAKLAEDLEKSLDQGAPEPDFWVGGDDPLYEEAKKLVIETRKASASFLQRRLRLGYARAARLIDMLEERGVVGPGEGAKPREVLVGTGGDKEENNGEWEKV